MLLKHLQFLQGQLRQEADGNGSDLGGAADAGSGDSNQSGDDNSTDSKSTGDKDTNKPTDAEATLIKDMMKWKTKAQDSEKELSTLKEQVGELSGIKDALGDLDVDTIKTLVGEKKNAEKEELERKGEYERIVDQMKEANQKEIGKYTEQIDSLNTQIEELNKQLNGRTQEIEDMTVGRSFSESKYIKENSVLSPRFAQKEFGGNFEFEDGAIVAYDKPRGANERTKLVDAQGNNLKFEDAIARLYEKHPESEEIIRSKQRAGAGSQSDGSSSKASKPEVTGIGRIAKALAEKSK